MVSADCILKQKEAHELFVRDDGKLSCSEGPSPQGEVTSKLELREDKLFITKTYEVNEDGKAYNSMQLSVKNHFIGTGLAIIKSIVFS